MDEQLLDDAAEEDAVVPAALANHYDRNDEIIRTAGPAAARATLEMWTAVLEIHSRQSWRARFPSHNQWIKYLVSLNIYGMGRSSIWDRINIHTGLVTAGVERTTAAIATSLIPTVVDRIKEQSAMRQAAGDSSPTDFVQELIAAPSTSEAHQRVRDAAQGSTSLRNWIQDVDIRGDKLLAKIVREDSRGYSSYDVVVHVNPCYDDQTPVIDVLKWLAGYMRGKA